MAKKDSRAVSGASRLSAVIPQSKPQSPTIRRAGRTSPQDMVEMPTSAALEDAMTVLAMASSAAATLELSAGLQKLQTMEDMAAIIGDHIDAGLAELRRFIAAHEAAEAASGGAK
jgi:hypothetical protein